MIDLLAKGTDRGYSMIGVGLSAGLSGSRRARTVQDPLPALDLDWATNRSLPASYGPTPSFSRASTGTYFDGQGILRSAAVNGPRFNHVYNGTSWVSRGLLVEEQRTNSFNYSQDHSNAYWTKYQITPGYNTTETTAPDGTNTATKATSTVSSECSIYRATGIVSTGTYTYSAFFKAGTASIAGLEIYENGTNRFAASFTLSGNGSTATIFNLGFTGCSSSILDVGNGWYRCSITITRSTTTGLSAYHYLSLNSTTAITTTVGTTCYLWGSQLENGGFSTSYIGTTNSSVVRSADVCQITGSDFSGFWNATEGSFAVELDLGAPVTGITYYPFYFGASDTATNTKRLFYFSDIPPGTSSLYVSDGTTTSKLTTSNIPGNSTTFKAAMCYKADDLAISLNGAAVVTDLSQPIPTGLDRLQIGSNPSANNFNGHIARLRYFPTRLTNAKLQELST